MMKIRLTEDNSLTYELCLPKDGRVRVSTTLGNGSKDSFVVNLNKTEITLENYLQTANSMQPFLKTEGEYLLISRNFEERIFKIRRFIYDEELANSIIPLNDRFVIEYINESAEKNASSNSQNSDILYLRVDINKKELRTFDFLGSSLDSNQIHGIGLYSAWCWLSYFMLITGRYMRCFYLWRMILHTFLGIAILILTIVFINQQDGDGEGTNSFGEYHESLAVLTLPWIIFEVVCGIAVKFALIFLVHMSWVGIWCRVIHMWTAYGCIIANNVVVLSGIYIYGSPLANYLYLQWGILIIITIALEIVMRCTSKWRYENIHYLDYRNLKEITIEEFLTAIKNGKKWALFDDFVVDLSGYYFEHPGSTYVLKESIGCDVGKYFYGSYTMEDSLKPVTHSRMAGRILFNLIFGKIKHNSKAYQVFTSINDSSQESQKGTTFMFKVKEKTEITKDIWRVLFENKKLNIKKFYKGLSLAGRGFLISSPRNQVSRYYTICNCMGSKIYEEYRSAMISCINDKPYSRKYKSIKDYIKEKDNCLELIMKFYKQTRTGITRQVDDADKSTEFYIDGPHGKGFNLTPDNSNGTHVIFMGGTGALPFMDLFAYLARKLLTENSPDYSIFPDEKFDELNSNAKWVVYGYFPSRDRSVGLEFCELINDLHIKFQKESVFKFIPVFTRDGGARLTEQNIDEILTKIYLNSVITRIFVCGPPPQNNLFQRCMRRISRKIGLPRNCYDIL